MIRVWNGLQGTLARFKKSELYVVTMLICAIILEAFCVLVL